MTIKSGTRIEVSGTGLDWQPTWEAARIMRWSEKLSGPRANVPGFHKVKFDADGAILLVHETRFRVTDNRA